MSLLVTSLWPWVDSSQPRVTSERRLAVRPPIRRRWYGLSLCVLGRICLLHDGKPRCCTRLSVHLVVASLE